MAFLKPDKTWKAYGIEVSEKLITNKSGVINYSGRLLNTPGNKPAKITVHNTPDIKEASGTNDAEQYARATYNNAMGDVVVHYYLDETACWHILDDNTVGYHAGDGKYGTGNNTSIAVEIIMDGSGYKSDIEAENRGAELVAYLMKKYNLTINDIVPHRTWNGKYCPAYILPHWDKFIEKVKKIDEDNSKPKTDKLYYVQVGAFKSKANAEAYAEEVKKKGFNAVIK